jgi:hypothetical protein
MLDVWAEVHLELRWESRAHRQGCFSGRTTRILPIEENRNLQRAHFSLIHATPLLPAHTLSEGEFRVSAGERR